MEAWQLFLGRLDKILMDSEQDRYLLERSLEVSSREMEERWKVVEKERLNQIEIERMRTAQAEKMAALGEMAGGLAHEVNSPLAIISLLTEQSLDILQGEAPDYNWVVGALKKVQSTTDRIAKIVKGLRLFSRDGSDDPFAAVRVDSLIDDTLAFCRERFRHGQVELLYENSIPGATLECRSTQISQVLLNLLNNAYDAISSKPKKWVRLNVRQEGTHFIISVTDCGDGIPPAIAEKIFQPFFTTKAVGSGTGLGLSLTKGILDAHSASISLNTQSPNTCFEIKIPARHNK